MKRHVFAMVGKTLDRASQTKGKGPQRFERRWRPTVALAGFPGITHLHLIACDEDVTLAKQVEEDAKQLNANLAISIDVVNFSNPWALPDTYLSLLEYVEKKTEKIDEKDELFISITTGTHLQQICAFLLVESKRFRGKLLQSAPSKDVRHESEFQIIDLDLASYDVIAQRFKKERHDAVSVLKGGIKTRNAKFNALIEEIETVVTASTHPILLMGPTGAGKSDLAERIYQIRKKTGLVAGEMVSVNCSTLQGDNLLSALFGHTKGAFTGAHAPRQGLLKAADGGLLFLDEIGEMSIDSQTMLLSAIEKKRFYPLGSDKEVSSDFLIIAGTNRNLRKQVEAGKFREDLLARINIWEFHLPSLKERKEDIEPNIDFELDRMGDELGRRIRLQGEARTRYLTFALSNEAVWSGNFRELLASLVRLSTMAPDGVITQQLVTREIDRLRQCWGGIAMDNMKDAGSWLRNDARFAHIDDIHLAALERVAEVCSGTSSAAEASRILFNKSRLERKSTNDSDRLVKYLKQFGLSVADFVA